MLDFSHILIAQANGGFNWPNDVVRFHVLANVLLAAAFFFIPACLIFFAIKRRDLAFNRFFLLFALFALLCGSTQALGAWSLWHSDSHVTGVAKLISGLVSVFTAGLLAYLLPQALSLPTMQGLKRGLQERRRAEDALKEAESIRESEARFRAMADSAPVLIWIADANKKFTYFNKVWLEFTGRTLAEETGTGWAMNLHPDDIQRCISIYSTAFEEREVFKMEYRLRRHDGEYRWMVDNGVPRYDQHGEFEGYIGSCVDITDRKKMEAALLDAKDRLLVALDAGKVGAWDWDVVNDQVKWSDRLYQFHGITTGTFGGRVDDFTSLVHPEDAERVGVAIKKAMAEKGSFEAEFRAIRPGGEIRWLSTGGRVITDSEGKVVRMLGATVDITESKRTAEALEESQERYSALLKVITSILWTADPNGEFIAPQLSWEKFTGQSWEQYKGCGWLDAIHPDDRESSERMWRAALKGASIYESQYRLWHADSQDYRYMWVRGVPVIDSAGGVREWIGKCLEVHERIVAEQALKVNERRVALAMEAAQLGTWEIDLITHQKYESERMAQLFGLPPGETNNTYELWRTRLHPDDLPRVEQEMQEAIDGDGEYQTEYRVIWADGSIHWIAPRGIVLRDESGRPNRIVGVAADTTRLKESEDALRISRERLDLVLSTSELGLWYCDLPFDKLIWNDKCKQHFGLPLDTEVTIDVFYQHIHPDDREPTRLAIEKSIADRVNYDMNYRTLGEDGTVRWIRAIGRGFYDDDGRPVRFDGITVDISESKRTEEETRKALRELELAQEASLNILEDLERQKNALQEAYREIQKKTHELERSNLELNRSNQELDDFAYIASHDLKEPLRGIHNYSTFLLEDYADKLDNNGRAKLVTLTQLTRRMETLIDSLLHYSRVGRLELSLVPTDLNVLLSEVLEGLMVMLKEREIEIRIPRPLPTIQCDRVGVGEVFHNLIANASKYNDKEKKWIEIGYDEDSWGRLPKGDAALVRPEGQGPIIFYVRDNGIGIPEKHYDGIFRIFKRLHGRDKFGGGVGAGLTIVKKIVGRHNGQVWVDSKPGEGTTFFFTLQEIS